MPLGTIDTDCCHGLFTFQTPKKNSKHKEDFPTLKVNVTYEFEKHLDHIQNSSQTSTPSNHSNTMLANQNVLKTAASRPSPQGGLVASTPISIDNRLVINPKQNKNKEPQKVTSANLGNSGDIPATNIMINSEHIAKITLQQQELLKKQTQQLIQLKLQQEAKKHFQLSQQQKQAAQNEIDRKADTAKLLQNGAPPQLRSAVSSAAKSLQKVSVKNNVNGKATVETPAPSKAAELKNTMQARQQAKVATKVVAQSNEMFNRQSVQSPQPGQNKKAKKPADNLQQQSQQSPRAQPKHIIVTKTIEVPFQGQPLQSGVVVSPGSPIKGQVRQPPQGQAQNGDTRTSDSRQRELSKVKSGQEDSPPSDQVYVLLQYL